MDTERNINLKIRELLYQEELEGEKRVNKLSFFLVVVILIVIAINSKMTYFLSNLAYNIAALCLIPVYHIILYILLKKGIYNKYVKYISTSVHVTAVSVIFLGYAVRYGYIYSLGTITTVGYFIMIAVSGFYQKPSVAAFTTGLVVLQFVGIFIADFIITFASGNDMLFYRLNEIAGHVIAFTVMLTAAGLSVFLIASRLKTVVKRSIIAEAEIYKKTIEQHALEESSKMKTNFFINIAHETKTPLTLIKNYLNKDIEKRGGSEEISIVKNNLGKMERDIINFIDTEKLIRGSFIYDHNHTVNISEFLRKKAGLFKDLAGSNNILLNTVIKDSLYTRIDPSALDRILNNLLDNAVKFSKAEVRVDLKADSKNIFLSVKNDGEEIPESEQNNIFKPFYQVFHKKRNRQGIGMGLSIVKRVLDGIGGNIDVESSEEKGTEFTAVFQRCRDTEDIIESEPSKPAGIYSMNKLRDKEFDKAKQSILLVEDNRELLAFLQNELIQEYNIFTAVNGKQALTLIKTNKKPDLIISDIMMDEMDGEDFLASLIADPELKNIPFIFLTAKKEKEDRIRNLNKGAFDYIVKPFDIEELKSKIASLLSFIKTSTEKLQNDIKKRVSDAILNLGEDGNKKLKNRQKIYEEFRLSKRKTEICNLLLSGLYNKEIAYELGIDIKTVQKHLTEIYRTFNVNNRIELYNIFN